MADNQELIAAIQAAGAVGVDVWRLARTDIPVADAVRDVQRRYPAAFTPPFNARTATRAECDAWMQEHTANMEREAMRRRNEAAVAEMQRRFGDTK